MGWGVAAYESQCLLTMTHGSHHTSLQWIPTHQCHLFSSLTFLQYHFTLLTLSLSTSINQATLSTSINLDDATTRQWMTENSLTMGRGVAAYESQRLLTMTHGSHYTYYNGAQHRSRYSDPHTGRAHGALRHIGCTTKDNVGRTMLAGLPQRIDRTLNDKSLCQDPPQL